MRKRPSRSTTRKESEDYDSRKYPHNYRREHPSNSKDCQKKIEWASALKRDQLRKEALESQQPPTADSERMINEPTMLQQAGVATVQQKPQQIVQEYKIRHCQFGKQQTPPEERYTSVPTAPITAQIQPRTTHEVIIINYFNRAHLNFDPTILRQATAASQQIAQDFPDYF
uniref:Uncharacterized protein n=1 Tax=Romanomermis culicivorax TaxID=13658 RepID=A0A915K4Z7_ROMCU